MPALECRHLTPSKPPPFGAASATATKKSFDVQLQSRTQAGKKEKFGLLGMPADSDWILYGGDEVDLTLGMRWVEWVEWAGGWVVLGGVGTRCPARNSILAAAGLSCADAECLAGCASRRVRLPCFYLHTRKRPPPRPQTPPSLRSNWLAYGLYRDAGRYAPRTVWVETFLVNDSSTALAMSHYIGSYIALEKLKIVSGCVCDACLRAGRANAHCAGVCIGMWRVWERSVLIPRQS